MPRWVLFLVPPLYLAAVAALHPAGRLGPSDAAPRLSLFLYDDYDVTALALRGLNASEGRTAGRSDPPPKLSAEQFREALDDPTAELRPRFFLEYPHTVLWLAREGLGDDPADVSAAVLDGCHNNVVEHVPQGAREQILWDQLLRAAWIYRLAMLACLLVLMGVLAIGYSENNGVSPALLLLPGALFFTFSRFDILPALLTALSCACLGRRRFLLSAVFLGAATMVKVYPILLAPLVVRYLSDNRRTACAWAGAYALMLAAFLAPPLALSGWEATVAPYRFQLTRPPELRWTLYGYVLPRFLAEYGWFRLGCVLLTLAALLWRRPEDLADLLRRGAVVLLVFVALQGFYSPQWILWLSPFLLPLVPRERRLLLPIVALDVVSYLSLLSVLPDSPIWPALRAGLILARAALLVRLGWLLWPAERASGVPAVAAAPTALFQGRERSPHAA